MSNSRFNYGTIGVVMGGDSAEREISLMSGSAVAEALENNGHIVERIDGMKALKAAVKSKSIQTVFNILHGAEGENGLLAAWLQAESIRYTGSGYEGAVLSWLKDKSKLIVEAEGLKTPSGCVVGKTDFQDHVAAPCPGPWIVKPASEGSSIGMSKVEQEADLNLAVSEALRHSDRVLIEQYISGIESTVAIVDSEVLPVVSIEPIGELYDYEAKYESTETRYHCPSKLTEEVELKLQKEASIAFESLGLKGWARIDFIVDAENTSWFLEANTTPGMTVSSLVPKAADAQGWSFEALVERILSTSVKNEGGANE